MAICPDLDLSLIINNQTPDPRFQRVLVAARELAHLEVDVHGSSVDLSVLASGLQRLRDALADLEKDSAGIPGAIKKKQVALPRKL